MLEIRGLNQFYGGSHTLRGIDLSVPAGTCTALLGRNGVGKTTLLRCIMGLLPARSGRIAFEGEDIGGLTAYQRARLGIGYVPQGREIFPRLTVAENLAVGEAAAGDARPLTPREEIEALFPVLRAMQRRRGGDLSGGQQQQLAIARALVARPKLLLLDRGMTILLVEQYVDFARSLAQHYAILSRGQVVDRGEVAKLDTEGVRHHLAV